MSIETHTKAQILATALGYGVFLAALGVAFAVRHLLFKRHRH